ncbi:MAG: hypothetical protein Q7S94_00670 [Gallionella sp.]|nr:hypothetical protein [Gallionella sp.]
MKNINTLFSCLSLTVVCFMAASPAAYAAIAGHVQFVSGDVQIANPTGQARSAQKGDAINEGDTLTSAPKSSAQIKMQDGGFIAIRPDSQMKFDQFVFAGKEDGSEKSFFSVFKGGFRAITGAIGQVNKHNYRITTPTASIGIRGSDHETLVVIPGSPLAQLAPTGSYSKVNVGGTSMTTNEGTLNVGPNQMGFAGSLNQSPQLQPLNTNIFTVAPAPVITPGVNAGETETEQQAAAQETSTDSATQDETPPIREVAVVDTTAPRTGGAPAANAPPMTTTTVAEVVEPPAPTTVMPTTTVAGLDVNLTTGTATTNTGQLLTITQGLVAAQAQTAADAAANAATGAQAAANTAQTDNAQLAALAPVDTAPASTAIATADPLVTGAATSYSGVSVITPVATTSAATAVSTATTNVNAAATAVTAANALAPVATTPADAAILAAGNNIGTASTAVTAAGLLAPVATTAATTAIGTAGSHISTATPVVTAAGTLTPANATLAADNAAAAAATAGTASTQTTAAANQLAANATFADATAAPALAAAQAANTTLQSANTAVQGAVTPVSTNNASLTAAQTAAQNALIAANNNLAAANTSLNTATNQNAALTAAQLAAQNALTAANNNLAAANTSLTTATNQNAALTAAQLAAQSALDTAQTNLTAANTNLNTATAQNAALTTAQLAAQNALTTAQANLVAANTNLNTATVQNNTITAAQTSAPAQLTAAQTAAAAAQTAALAAQTAATQAATLQAAGDLVGAQAQLLIAQQQLAIAQTQQTAATSAQTALTTSLTSAQTAQTTGLTNVNNAVAAATAAQTAANTASTQAALVSPAAYAASTALVAVTPAASTAITDAGTASAQAAAAQTAVGAASTAVTTAITAANTAATDAGSAGTQATAAQTAVSTATNAVSTAASAANTASTDAGIASTQASAAQTAATDAAAALSTSITNLATVNTNAPLVAANAPVAAYNNPAVVTPDRFVGVLATVVTPTTGQYIEGYGPGAGFAGVGTANTSFVLDGAGNLVESRHAWYEETPASTATTQILVADANIKRTGGVAAEAFKLADNSIYGGRWTGGSLTVTDNTPGSAMYTPVPVFTRNLGNSSEHWAIMLTPATAYVQALTGTTSYTMASATSPTDALGNVGVLNSATLSANFTSQLVSAALNLGISAKTLDVQTPNMPINGSGFSTNNGVTATCTGCTGTYYANVGGMFAGDAAASAGLSYTLWAGAAPGATTPAADLIQGLVVFSTEVAPTVQPFATLAQTAATDAAAAATAAQNAATTALGNSTTLAGLGQVSTAPAVTAISTATTDVGAAGTAVSAATAINLATTLATATDNANAAQASALTASTLAGSAQTALTAHGVFADTTATTANTTIQDANSVLQTATTTVQAAAGTVTAQSTALSTAQGSASTALGTASTSLTTANTSLTAANIQNTAIVTAQGSITTPLTAVQTAAANAQVAATAAQTAADTAATLQAGGDLVGAQAQLLIAQQQLAIAQAEQTNAQTAQSAVATQLTNAQTAQTAAGNAVTVAANAATTAATNAGTASTQASAAQTAADNAAAALSTSTTNLVTVNTQAPIIASNAPIAAYNNPAVAGNFIAAAMFPVAVTGGFNEAFAPTNPLQPNTTYVLDVDGNLVEARNLPFQVQTNQNGNVLTPSITATTGADIKWSGGTAADTFKLADNSLYAGRWMGGTVTVTDNAVPTNVYTYTPAASLWAVILPPPAGYVPALVGTTTYNVAGSTKPVDAIGTLGILTNASLTANFTSQLVDAAVSLTMDTGTMAGTFNVSAVNMPIDFNGGFGVPNASALTTSCTTGTGTCAAGATGYSADLGGSFAGTSAASIGLSYNIWPTALSTDAAINSIMGLVAFSTATAPTTGTHPLAGNYGIDFMNPVTIAGGYNTGLHNNTLPMANTSIRLDGAGNLVKLFGTTYQEPGGSPYATTQLPPIVSLANANIAWSGGTAADYHQSTSGAVTFGRWEGGIVAVTDLSTTTPASFTTSLTGGTYGPTSSLWAYATGPANGFVQSLTGTTSYTKTAHTTPFDSQGGMGVLNSASLSANFTSQLVNAALNLTMNTGLLAGDTFDVAGNMPINSVSGSNSFKSASPPTVACTVGPCALATGESFLAEMSGAFVGATAVDAVLGYAVWLETPTSPADIVYGYVAFNTGVAPTVNLTGPLAAYVATNTAVAYTGAYGGSFNFIAAPGEITPVGNPTTFTQNYGNGSGYRRDVLNSPSTTTSPTTTTNGITFGVWETVTSVTATERRLMVPSQNGNMLLPSYMYGAEGYLDSAVVAGTTGPLAGTFSYNQVAATSYDSGSWAAGSLTRTTLSANFTSQTLSLGLSGTMGTDNWTLDSTNRPITFMNSTTGTGARFSDSAPVITVNASACATNCGGNVSGAFLGQNYAGAIVQYSLWDNNNLNLGGLVGFDRMPVTTNPTVSNGTPTTGGAFVVANSLQLASSPTVTTSYGLLTEWSGTNWLNTVEPVTGGVVHTAVGTGSGSINWGSWAEGSMAVSNFSYTPGFAQLHWITAPEPTPVYLAQVLTTTNAVYNFVDGDVTNMFSVSGGGHGTINGTTSLTANFATQTVAANLNLTVGGNTWAASTSNAPLEYSNGNILNAFSADSYRSPSQPGYLTVIVNPGTGQIVAGGSLNGQLVGAALDGAILKFNLVGVPAASTEWVQGVAALGAAVANDTATSYRVVLSSISEPMALVPTVMLGGAYNNAARVSTDINGHLTQFDDNSGGGSSTIQHVSGGYADQGSFTVGSDTVSWGRWTAGTVVNVQDRTSGVWQNNITLAGGAHAVVGSVATGPVSLPTSGTYTYNQVGGTSPTDQAGVAGTLNSATLSANFTAQTVDVGVNVTAGGATLNAAATSVPIMNRANFFTDSKMTGAGALAVTCTAGLCGTTNGGGIGGGFGGTGGVVAAITYGFEKGGLNAGTVNGVAVFQQVAAQ